MYVDQHTCVHAPIACTAVLTPVVEKSGRRIEVSIISFCKEAVAASLLLQIVAPGANQAAHADGCSSPWLSIAPSTTESSALSAY